MLKKEIKEIIDKSKKWGWVLEPDAQKIFSLYGFKTPKYDVATSSRSGRDDGPARSAIRWLLKLYRRRLFTNPTSKAWWSALRMIKR